MSVDDTAMAETGPELAEGGATPTLPADVGTLASPAGNPTEGPVVEELSQAKARFGVSLFALAYLAGWSFFAGSADRLIVAVLLGYTAFSAFWILLVKQRPGEVIWRRLIVIFSDLGINTFFMHALQAKGAFFYPMYLWIIVGNGVRYGPRYLTLAMAVGVAYFGPMLFWSDYWQANAVAGSGLLAGMVVLPMFYLTLIKNLHQANARLSEEVERSQAAARAKTEFLANMSHELRTPMSGVIGVSELMRATALTDTQKEYLEIIRRSAGALLHIIDDVLELSRIEEGKITLKPVALDLEQIIDDVYNLLQPGAGEKGLKIRVIHPTETRRTFIGDPTRIRQILINLLGNAVKFTEQGHIDLAYRFNPRPDGHVEVSLRVADTGVGIAGDKLEHVFGKFERVQTHTGRPPGGGQRKQVGGSGLGLAISRHLARLMAGDITVSSELGRGSVFTVTMILEPSDESPVDVSPQAGKRNVPPEAGKRDDPSDEDEPRRSYAMNVLVVEDNPVNQLVIQGYLQTLGLTVETAGDGRAALKRVREQTFDLVFMDVRLPVMDGLETTRHIRAEEAEGQHLPIVALTANAFAEDRQACLEAGMDLHLRKPMQLEDLQGAIETLGKRGLMDQTSGPDPAHPPALKA